MASFSDDYNRANGFVGINWTLVLGFGAGGAGGRIVSNQANGDVASSLSGSMVALATATFAATQEAQITSKGGNYHGPGVRMTTPSGGNGYAYFNLGSLQVITAGANSVIGSPATFTTNDVIRFRGTGSTLETWKNGSSNGTVTDATHATGQPGTVFYDNVGFLDDFSATDVFGGGVVIPVFMNQYRQRWS